MTTSKYNFPKKNLIYISLVPNNYLLFKFSNISALICLWKWNGKQNNHEWSLEDFLLESTLIGNQNIKRKMF